jgi:MFS family permease
VPSTLVRNRDFLKYWAASAISDVGSQITLLAFPLIGALTLNATPWEMGVLNAAQYAPVLLISLFAGVWIDRMRRRPVLIVADLVRAVLLALVPMAAVAGRLSIELLCVVAFLIGALSLMFDLAHLSFLPSLVTREHLVEGNAKLEATAAAAQVAGPGLGGVLVGALGAPVAVLFDALSFLGSGWLLLRTRAHEAAPARDASRASVVSEIREGIGVVLAQPMLRALAMTSATNAFGGRMFFSVYVLYMTRDLGLSPMGIGLVLAIGGVGSVVGAMAAGTVNRRLGVGPTLIVSQLVFGLTGLMVPLAVVFPSIALEMIVASEFTQWMAIVVYYVDNVSVRQSITPQRMLGRVNATIRSFAGGMMPIGALVGGALGGWIGLAWTLVVAELILLTSFVWLLFSPVRALRTL